MNDFNSRYRNIDDQTDTIRTNTGGYGFDNRFGADMDIMEAENEHKKKQVARASQARGTSKGGRKSKREMLIYAIIIAIEIIALIIIWTLYFKFNSSHSSKGSDAKAQTEASQGGGSINVDNDSFSLACTKIAVTTDSAGAPIAVVYFTFSNKTETPLSMSQVFIPSFKQAGVDLPSAGSIADEPVEIANKDAQISGGQEMVCAYAVSLQDTTSEITITMRDNYETFSDIGSTVVPIS